VKKTALITGGNGTIGSAIAKKLSSDYNIIITYNKSKSKAYNVLNNINSNKNKIIKVDLSSLKSIKKMFAIISKEYETLDLLVNNASFTKQISVEDIDESTIQKIIELNFKSIFYCSREFLNFCDKTNDKNIINIGSNSVRTLNASNMIYIACKSAIESLTKSFAKHYGEFVRVNCVNPGLVKSYLSKDFFDDRKKYVISKTPIKKLTTPNDIAEIVFNIVTNIKMLNGQCIDVDGGRTL
jgi:3-oxoacyl-[acyl-carrier protein] reductase